MNDWIKAIIFVVFAIVISYFVISLYWDVSAVACGENETLCRVLFVFR